ncbi:MAG TPA: hypothetical protein VGH10_06465 [Actinomycetota bacterium]|jgi:hypothetical protein
MKDATGTRELTAGEQKIVEAYAALREALTAHRTELPPFAERSAVRAVAVLWQAMNGLDMDPGQVYHLGA